MTSTGHIGVTESITEWALGWAAVRGLAEPRPTLASAVAVRVGRAGRTVEYVVTTPGLDPGWLRGALLGDGASPDQDWVTIPLAENQPAEPPPGFDWARRDIEWLMRYYPGVVIPLDPHEIEGYVFDTERLPSGAITATCTSTKDGERAGAASMIVLGDYGVVDAVEVSESHRRKGIASRLMAELHNAAALRSANRLVLMATADGKALYESLGWRVICRAVMTTCES